MAGARGCALDISRPRSLAALKVRIKKREAPHIAIGHRQAFSECEIFYS